MKTRGLILKRDLRTENRRTTLTNELVSDRLINTVVTSFQ